MSIEQQIASLTTATTDLLSAVNVKKATLDSSVLDAQNYALSASADKDQAAAAAAAAAAQDAQAAVGTAAAQAQAWAEGVEPGGPGTLSAKAWAESIPMIVGPAGPQGPQGEQGPQGPNSIAGYTFQMTNPTPGDLVIFDGSYWVNEPKQNILDGGNF